MATLRHPARRLLFFRPRRKVSCTHLTWRLYNKSMARPDVSKPLNKSKSCEYTHTHTERERERECSVVCAAAYTLLNVEVVVCDDAGHEDQIDDNNNNLYGKKVFCSIAKPVIMISCSFWIVCVIYLFYFFFSWIFPSTITITATALKLQYCLLPSLSENDDRWLDRTTV